MVNGMWATALLQVYPCVYDYNRKLGQSSSSRVVALDCQSSPRVLHLPQLQLVIVTGA